MLQAMATLMPDFDKTSTEGEVELSIFPPEQLEAAAQVGFRLVYFHACHLFLLSEVFVVCRFSALFRSRLMACTPWFR